MGWHTDIKYSKSGKFSNSRNTQLEHTPTVIVTFGDSRCLKWRKVIYDNENKATHTKAFLKMILTEGTILILHPGDECPHLHQESGGKIKYEHGNINIGKDECSIAFVFRVVSQEEQFRSSDNCLINNERNALKKDKEKEIDMMYDHVDTELYHTYILKNLRC